MDVCAADGACQYAMQAGVVCDDGNECTSGDHCNDDAVCAGQESVVCDDGNACTKDSCNPTAGCAYAAEEDGTACEDGTQCTADDTCFLGVCVGGEIVQCVDEDPDDCSYKVCNAVTGQCDKTEVLPEGNPCKDGNPCTDADECDDKGICIAGEDHECHAQNPCQKSWRDENAAEGTNPCDWGWKDEDVPCDDKDACTTNDKCISAEDGGLKCTGEPLDCNDQNPCTSDACDEDAGCSSMPLADGTPCQSSSDPCAVAGKECGPYQNCQCGPCPGSKPFCIENQWKCVQCQPNSTCCDSQGGYVSSGQTGQGCSGECKQCNGSGSCINKPSGTPCNAGNGVCSNGSCGSLSVSIEVNTTEVELGQTVNATCKVLGAGAPHETKLTVTRYGQFKQEWTKMGSLKADGTSEATFQVTPTNLYWTPEIELQCRDETAPSHPESSKSEVDVRLPLTMTPNPVAAGQQVVFTCDTTTAGWGHIVSFFAQKKGTELGTLMENLVCLIRSNSSGSESGRRAIGGEGETGRQGVPEGTSRRSNEASRR